MTTMPFAAQTASVAGTFAAVSHAFVRKPGPAFGTLPGHGIGIADPDRALYQHDAYCRTLVQLGVEVRAVKYDPAYPDGCFLNDTAVVAGNLAVIGRFADNSTRHGEEQLAASLLAGSRILKSITAPGTLDAADVAEVGGHFFIGLSNRTNHEGAAQLAHFLAEFGFAATVLNIGDDSGLRLGNAVCDLGPGPDGHTRILLREDLAKHYAFITDDKIIVPWAQRAALQAVMINGHLLLPAGFALLARRISESGIRVHEAQVSEFEKIGGGLRSLALRLPARRQENVVRLMDRRVA